MSENKTIVNSWNEWDPLKHVIVGRADGTCIPAPEPALDAKVPEDSDMRGQFGPRTKDTIDKANELLDGFANILKKKDIKVDRPTPIDFIQEISTPDWKVESMFGCMPPRDVLLTVGNEILEATMSYRCRWFEYLCYRPLLKHYYNSDPNMRHESAPKPRLTDADYSKDYLSEKIGYWRYILINRHLKANPEKVCAPLFDFFEPWCQDENRHGDCINLMMRCWPGMTKGFRGKLLSRFFLWTVFLTHTLTVCERGDFYTLLGIDPVLFDEEVIIQTNNTSRNAFPWVFKFEDGKFLDMRIQILNSFRNWRESSGLAQPLHF